MEKIAVRTGKTNVGACSFLETKKGFMCLPRPMWMELAGCF